MKTLCWRKENTCKYFCSFSYTDGGEVFFGNTIMYVQVDPYDDIEEFMDLLEHRLELQGYCDVVLLFYKKVKAWEKS